MPRPRVRSAATLCLVLIPACGGDDTPARQSSHAGGSGPSTAGAAGLAWVVPSSGGSGGASQEAGAGPGVSGPGGQAGAGGAGVPSAVCGNEILESGEACDGDEVTLGCQDLGFETGELKCTADCGLDTSGCSGAEHCEDLRDNDGDRRIDCEDSDCAGECADPCLGPVQLEDPAELWGDLTGRGNLLDPLCGVAGVQGGSELVMRFVAANTGILDVALDAEFPATLSVRSECAADASELLCSTGARITLDVEQGDVLYLVVGGLEASDAGRFTLEAMTRPIACGDAFRDTGEACDDGNTRDGDGCSQACAIESSESSNNDGAQQADPYAEPFIGEISPAGDEDFVEFVVAEPSTSVVASTFDLGDGACSLGLLDSELEILSGDGASLAFDDDGGERYCARVLLGDLGPGTYLVRVAASSAGWTPTFPYRLALDLDVCGNGRLSDAEGCDDGNVASGDGCSSSCTAE